MLQLNDDQLTFTFPEIAWRLCSLLEQHLQNTVSKIRLPEDRNQLVFALDEELDKTGELERSPDTSDEKLFAAAKALTVADVEAALRECAYETTNLEDESLAQVGVGFQRTLRIPDDGRTYPLPAGLGRFPLRSVDDFAATAPDSWIKRGGVTMPMYQSEALWIRFSSRYPFAVQIGSGKINAISGEAWTGSLQRDPQNYVVVPRQPWLDGFAVGEGLIRQFVAMPLGDGYSVEEQLTGKADVGGLQLQVYPMSADHYFHQKVAPSFPRFLRKLLPRLFAAHLVEAAHGALYSRRCPPSMGLGAGGRMRQEIYRDPYPFEDWDQTRTTRCFVHLCNSLVWREITGTNPPHPPLTASEYKQAGIPWFDYYRDDIKPLKGSKHLAGVKSVTQLGEEKHTQPLPENTSISPDLIIQYGNTRRPGEIRELLDAP